jgi:hypothetical protein
MATPLGTPVSNIIGATLIAISEAALLKAYTPLPVRSIAAFAISVGVITEACTELSHRLVTYFYGKDSFAIGKVLSKTQAWVMVGEIAMNLAILYFVSMAARTILNRRNQFPLSNKILVSLSLGAFPLIGFGQQLAEIYLNKHGYTLKPSS